ncbi:MULTISPECIES: cupin domain-containing protein [Bradyrhizobium]|uniref:cupin domain-containing protein n=1 Tax=Bradyrhizobium TaxID=374 RepID=UPI001B8A893E|nr:MULTISPECIES: cupin domain-containing protein [Bradyrhizobium]MBR0971246.1 cupin domain-containing protein [Bradyrhizobium japonicum]
MSFFKIGVGLLAVLATSGFCAALAEDSSLEYKRVTSSDLKWSPLPSMSKGTQSTVLHGNPGKPGLYTVRVKVPANSKMPVHSHPDERVRVIISGTYYSALGDKVDASKLLSFPPGTFSHVPPKVWQFAETRDEEVVFEITGIGPTGIDYLNAEDDPRKQK